MIRVRPNVRTMTGYVPGEQPQDDSFIKLNTNENPYPCSPKVKAAVGRACQTGLQKYPEPTAKAFRECAAEVLGVQADQVLCGNGSDDLLTILTRATVDSGDLVRFPRPSYVLYDTLAEIQGAEVDAVPLNDDWTLPERFAAPSDRLRLVFLANPNSPSGTMAPADEVARLAAALPCPLVVDEAYADFASANCLGLVDDYENVIVTRSMSKSYALAGLRFGFAVAQPATIEQLAKVKDSYNCDALAVAGATAALADRAWFDEVRAAILATRARLTESLRGLGFHCVDSQANFVWCRHPTVASKTIYQQLKERKMLVRYMDYPEWGDGLRVSVGTDPQIDILLNSLQELLA